MPKEFSRAERVAEQIRRELAELIRLELKDPRVALVTMQPAIEPILETLKTWRISAEPMTSSLSSGASLPVIAAFTSSTAS